MIFVESAASSTKRTQASPLTSNGKNMPGKSTALFIGNTGNTSGISGIGKR
jgi:hypothetical protein